MASASGYLVDTIESTMTLLPDNERVSSLWRNLVLVHHVCGVQVHDARLVDITQAHGLTRILTLNSQDFSRYSEIQPIHPSEVPLESE